MKRIVRGTSVVALALLAVGPSSTRSDDRPAPDPRAAGAIDRVLTEWQRKASAISSVEVKYRLTTESKTGLGRTVEAGRAVLAAPNLALVEDGPVGPDDKAGAIASRMIWDGRSIFLFEMADRQVTRFPLDREPTTAPQLIRLPFFYRMTVEEAQRDYEWEVLREDQDRILLRAVPRAKPATSPGFRACVLELDRATFLPRRMVILGVDGDRRQDYRPVDIRINQVGATDDLTSPCLDAWSVREASAWVARIFLR